jgi:hypothetical protein
MLDTAAYLLTCYRYIELNPVRAGMVNHPAAYPWSSYPYNALDKPDVRVHAPCPVLGFRKFAWGTSSRLSRFAHGRAWQEDLKRDSGGDQRGMGVGERTLSGRNPGTIEPPCSAQAERRGSKVEGISWAKTYQSVVPGFWEINKRRRELALCTAVVHRWSVKSQRKKRLMESLPPALLEFISMFRPLLRAEVFDSFTYLR